MDHFLENEQIEALLRFELIGNVLEEPSQLHIVLFVNGTAKRREGSKPERNGSAIMVGAFLIRL